MGDESNSFHREIVRPHTEELLEIKADDLVLDIVRLKKLISLDYDHNV